MFWFFRRKQRQSSAPSTRQNSNIEQLKHSIELKKSQRLSRQQQIRETLSTLSMASGRTTSCVCLLIL